MCGAVPDMRRRAQVFPQPREGCSQDDYVRLQDQLRQYHLPEGDLSQVGTYYPLNPILVRYKSK